MGSRNVFLDAEVISQDRLMTTSRVWVEVRDVMSRDVATVSLDGSISLVADIMSRRNISCIVVVDKGVVAGIITERGLLRKLVAGGTAFDKAKAVDVMSSPVVTVIPDASILDAGKTMEEKRIRRLPVLEDGQLVGILTQTDLTTALTSYGMWRNVAEAMTRDAATVEVKAPVAEAAEIMSSRRISCVAVLEGNQVVGVLTERDVLRKIVALQKDPTGIRVEEVMSSPVLSVHPGCSIFSASRLMERVKIRRLVVVERQRLCGIVTQTDIFTAVRKKLQAEEEERLELLEKSEYGIYAADLDGKATYVNPALVKLLGLSDSAELLNKPFLPQRFWVSPGERARLAAELREKGFIESKELALINADGKGVYLTLSSTFTKNAHGEVNGSQGILRDITADKELATLLEAKEALRESEEKLSAILNHTPTVVYLKDVEGRYLFINRRYKELFHVTNEEIIGRTDYDIFPAEAADAFRKNDLDVLAANIPLEREEIVPHDDGLHTYISIKFPLADASDKAYGVCGISTDITERKRAEDALNESATRLQIASDATHIGHWDWDLRSNEVYFSPEWKRQLGYEDHEIPNRFEEWETRLHPDDRQPTLQAVDDYIKGRSSDYDVEFRLRHKDGSYRWIYTRADKQSDDDGNPFRLFGCHVDITERKRAAKEISQLARFPSENPNPVLRVSSDGTIIFANDSSRALLDVWGREVGQALPDTFRQVAADAFASGASSEVEVQCEGRTLSLSFAPVPDADCVNLYGLDVTERKKAEKALRRADEELRQVFKTAVPLCVTDSEYTIIRVNDKFCSLFGLAERDAVGRKCYDVRGGSSCHTPDCPMRLISNGEEYCQSEVLKQRSDGTTFSCITTATPYKGVDGEFLGTIENFVDITERKRAEEELQKYAEELEMAKETAERNTTELAKAFDELNAAKNNLERFNKAAVGREMRTIEVKREVNALLEELGREPKYKVTQESMKV